MKTENLIEIVRIPNDVVNSKYRHILRLFIVLQRQKEFSRQRLPLTWKFAWIKLISFYNSFVFLSSILHALTSQYLKYFVEVKEIKALKHMQEYLSTKQNQNSQ